MVAPQVASPDDATVDHERFEPRHLVTAVAQSKACARSDRFCTSLELPGAVHEAKVFVESHGLVIDGVNDDQPRRDSLSCLHDPLRSGRQQRRSEALALEARVKR